MQPEIGPVQNLCVEAQTPTTDLVSLLGEYTVCHFCGCYIKCKAQISIPPAVFLSCFSAWDNKMQKNDESINGALNLNCLSQHYTVKKDLLTQRDSVKSCCCCYCCCLIYQGFTNVNKVDRSQLTSSVSNQIHNLDTHTPMAQYQGQFGVQWLTQIASTWGPEEIKPLTYRLVDDMLYFLSHSCPTNTYKATISDN